MINAGDLITTSSKKGYGMKCYDELKCLNAVVGIATKSQKQKDQKIMVVAK